MKDGHTALPSRRRETHEERERPGEHVTRRLDAAVQLPDLLTPMRMGLLTAM